jgi:archaellum component FlaC
MSQDINFKPLFEYLDQQFGEVKSEIANVKQSVQALRTLVDSLAQMIKDFRNEHIVLHRRLEALESWAKDVAQKVGIPLPKGIE